MHFFLKTLMNYNALLHGFDQCSYRCFLSFIGVFVTTRNTGNESLTRFYIDYGHIPGKAGPGNIYPVVSFHTAERHPSVE